MIYGYARVSTRGQDMYGNSIDDQETKLRAAGCEEIFRDSCTGTKMERPELGRLLETLRNGDRLVVTKLDRFARTTAGGIETIRELLSKGVAVHILNMGLIDNTPTGKLMVTMLLAFAEFERDMIVERTMAGKAVARQNKPGYREGRREKVVDETVFENLREKQKSGQMTVAECCRELKISRSKWYTLCGGVA